MEFGGNPSQITLMGQSAGAGAVHLHMMSNMTKHLFQRAISVSGSGFNNWFVSTKISLKLRLIYMLVKKSLHEFQFAPISIYRAVYTPHQARKWAEKLARFMRCPTSSTSKMMNCFRKRDPNFLTANLWNLYVTNLLLYFIIQKPS